MFFSGSTTLWEGQAQSDLLSQRMDEFIQQAMEKYPVTIDYAAICLGHVDMSA